MSDTADTPPTRRRTRKAPPRPPAPRTGWWWLALVLTGLLVLALAVTVGITVSITLAAKAKANAAPPPRPSITIPGPDDNPLGPGPGGVGDPEANVERDTASVKAFFARFAEAVRDPKGIPEDTFDWSEFIAAVPDDAVEAPVGPDGEPRDARWYGRMVVQSEQTVWRQWDWAKTDIRKVTRRPDGTAIEAVVVHTARDGKLFKRRWTFTILFDEITLLGWEDLRTGQTARDRAYARAASASSPSVRRQRHWRYEQVPEVHRLIDQRKWQAAEERVNELKGVKFDGDLQYAVDLAEARLAMAYRLTEDGEWDEELAVEILEDLVSKHPERLAAYPLLAETHLTGGEFRRAIEVCDACLSVTGPDADALALRGSARAALLEHVEAEEDFTAAEKLDRYQPRVVNHRLRMANAAGKTKVADRLATAPDAGTLFDALASWAITDLDWAGLRALAEKYRALRPKESRWVHPLVTALLETENADDAVAAFQAGVKVASADDRTQAVEQFARTMVAHGFAGRVYAAVPPADARTAFRVLAEHHESRRMRWNKQPDVGLTTERKRAEKDLQQLIDTHHKSHPDDPHAALHDGRLKFDRGEFKAAAEAMGPALAKLTHTGDFGKDYQSGYSPLLRELVITRHKLGEVAEAYRDLKPQADVFGQLIDLLTQDQDAAGLTKLLDARKEVGTDTSDELYWRAEVDRLAKRHAAAAKKYAEYLRADEPDAHFLWLARSKRVRCLVKANDLTAAEKEVTAAPADSLPTELRALVLAKAGRTAEAERLLREQLTARPWANYYYADEDLGPLLRGPAFARLRADFPPPDAKPQPPR